MEIYRKKVAPAGWTGRPSARRLSAGLLLLLLVALLAQTLVKADRTHGNDLTSYLSAARALARGDDPYAGDTPFPYIYPPTLAFLLIPLTLVPAWAAQSLWFALNTAALFYVLRTVSPSMHPASTRDPRNATVSTDHPLSILFYFILFFDILQNHLRNGQVNLVLLAAAFLFFTHHLNGRRLPAALFLSLAISIKLLPAILVLYLLWRKSYRTIALAAAFCLFWWFLPALCLGTDIFATHSAYLKHVLLVRLAVPETWRGTDFSLPHAIASVLPHLTTHAWRYILALLIVCFPISRRDRSLMRRAPRSRRDDLLLFSPYLLGIPLLSPMPQIHHLVFILPAVVLHGQALLHGAAEKRVAAGLGIFVLCLVGGQILTSGFLYFIALSVLYILSLGFYRPRPPAT